MASIAGERANGGGSVLGIVWLGPRRRQAVTTFDLRMNLGDELVEAESRTVAWSSVAGRRFLNIEEAHVTSLGTISVVQTDENSLE